MSGRLAVDGLSRALELAGNELSAIDLRGVASLAIRIGDNLETVQLDPKARLGEGRWAIITRPDGSRVQVSYDPQARTAVLDPLPGSLEGRIVRREDAQGCPISEQRSIGAGGSGSAQQISRSCQDGRIVAWSVIYAEGSSESGNASWKRTTDGWAGMLSSSWSMAGQPAGSAASLSVSSALQDPRGRPLQRMDTRQEGGERQWWNYQDDERGNWIKRSEILLTGGADQRIIRRNIVRRIAYF